jgi:hypothetical protein
MPLWTGIYVIYTLRCHLFVVILCSDDAFAVLQNAEHARGRTQARQRGTQDTTQGMLQPTVPLFLYFQYTVDRQILIFVWLVIPSLKNFTFRMNNIAINVSLELKITLSYVNLMHKIDIACTESLGYRPGTEFLDGIKVFLIAIHRHLYSFVLRFLFLQKHATSYSF